MAAKKKPAAMAKPARARRTKKAPPIGAKSALGAQLQAIADDTKCRAPMHTLVWSDRVVAGVGISEGADLYRREGRLVTPQPISRRRLAKLKAADA